MRDDPPTAARVGDGDQLNRQDTDHVGQNVWPVAEHVGSLRAAFAVLPRQCHELLSLSASDPPGRRSQCGREVSMTPAGWDDDELLAALREVMRAREAVPPEFVEAAENAFAWHDIGSELAQLIYDSSVDPGYQMSLRAEAASVRTLTFTSAHLTIEVEVTRDSLVGQIIPAQAGVIEVQPRDGAETEFPADEIGCFSIRPIPAGLFRLYCRAAAGTGARTGWITL